MTSIILGGRDPAFTGRTAGGIVGILAGLYFLGSGIWFYRWGKQIKAMTPEERRVHPRGQGIMGFSGIGYSLRHPWYAFAQAYFGIVLGLVVLVAFVILPLTGH